METLPVNKTNSRALPQDAFFGTEIVFKPPYEYQGMTTESKLIEGRSMVTLDRFYTLHAKRIYCSVTGFIGNYFTAPNPPMIWNDIIWGFINNGALKLSIKDKYSGREIMPPTDIRNFTNAYPLNDGYGGIVSINNLNPIPRPPILNTWLRLLDSRQMDKDNIDHVFREQAPIEFTASFDLSVFNYSFNAISVSNLFNGIRLRVMIMGERFFEGQNQGSNMMLDNMIEDPDEFEARHARGDDRIEYTWRLNPSIFRFTASLMNGYYVFGSYASMAGVNPDIIDGYPMCFDYTASNKSVSQTIEHLSVYKWTETQVSSSLPREIFNEAVAEPFKFNISNGKGFSFFGYPFQFSDHCERSEHEAYLRNRNEFASQMTGHLFGALQQTPRMTELDITSVTITLRCMIYEGKENVK
jgi:hypothetical protein